CKSGFQDAQENVMKRPRCIDLQLLVACCSLLVVPAALAADTKVTRYARFQVGDAGSYGIVEGNTMGQIDGDLFGKWQRTDKTYPLSSVKLLAPVARPSKVLAMAGNYKSHLGGSEQVTTVTTTTKVTTDLKSGQTIANSTTTSETEKP